MPEHRPTASVQVDIFPEESFLLDCTCDEGGSAGCPLHDPVTYSAYDVAREAWMSIGEWWQNGYLPVITVQMPDGTVQEIDLEKGKQE